MPFRNHRDASWKRARVSESTTLLRHLCNVVDSETRARFQLASRWFRKGIDAGNRLDQFIAWWVVLEIFPGEGDHVVEKARDLIAGRYPDIPKAEVKKRLGLGEICGWRVDVLHYGEMALTPERLGDFAMRHHQLEIVVRACLR